jgi:hypothetical protein
VTAGRAGQQVDDLCRQCKVVRHHTVVATDADGEIVRVVCDFCRSEHNFRSGGGVRHAPDAAAARDASPGPARLSSVTERTTPPMAGEETGSDLEQLLRRIVREELGLTPVTPAPKWRGGQLVLRPGNGTAEKAWPIDAFFHKIVMLRNRLRTLEQQVNVSGLPEDEKVKLQGYVTACYGTLTSFNVLFADADDQFRGSGGD